MTLASPPKVSDTCGTSLAVSASCTIVYDYTVPSGSPDQLVNTVTAVYNSLAGLNGTEATGSANWTVNLFQPSVEVTKTGDAFSKTGDTITYTVTIKNTSSSDSPNLILDTFTDTLVPAVDPPAACDSLAPNDGAAGGPDECSFTYTHVVTAGEGQGETLTNTATVHYHPQGFPNDITHSDGHRRHRPPGGRRREDR